MKKKKEISIRDIAQKAGCSTATVSRILNRQGGYSKALQERVLSIVENCGYTTGGTESRMIGILVPDLRNAFIAEEIVILEELLRQEGYHALICSTNEDCSREQFCLQGMKEMKAAAMISFLENENLAALAAKENFPILFMDRIPGKQAGLITVESDNYLGGYMATELLLKKGCRRILFLGWGTHMRINRERQRGYLDAHKTHGIKADPELLTELSDVRGDYDSARDMVYYLMKRKLKFDGIFATNDLRAQGALTALQMEQVKVPEQVRIVGFDDSPVCQRCHPALTSVRQDAHTMAAKTVECLIEQLQAPGSRLEKHVVIPVSVVERGTT